jgi:selenocysteine lyase/cysteine desulfurase
MEDELSTGMVSFNPFEGHVGGNISGLFNALWDKKIITRSIYFKLRTADSTKTSILRLCTHMYNNFDQLDLVFDEMESIVASL